MQTPRKSYRNFVGPKIAMTSFQIFCSILRSKVNDTDPKTYVIPATSLFGVGQEPDCLGHFAPRVTPG